MSIWIFSAFASLDADINSTLEDNDGAKNVDIVGTAVDLAIETESKTFICNLQTAQLNLNGDDTSAKSATPKTGLERSPKPESPVLSGRKLKPDP